MKKKKFTEVYRRYHKLVMKIVIERSGDVNAAEEICQKVFEAYYVNMDHIVEGCERSWIILTTKHAVVDLFRRKKTKEDAFRQNCMRGISGIAEDNTEKLVDKITKEQLTFRIMSDLEKTNVSWYRVMEAICIRGMTHEEAVEHLNMTSQVLRAKLYRARKYIREKYDDEYKES